MRKGDKIDFSGSGIRVKIGDQWLMAHSVEMSITGIFAKIINEEFKNETVEVPIGGKNE